jgi:predicted nucleotide-binding protein
VKIQVPKSKALTAMRRVLNEIEHNSHAWTSYYSEGYDLWRKQTQTVLKNIFGDKSSYLLDFSRIPSTHSLGESEPDRRLSVVYSVNQARTLLSVAIQEVEDFVADDEEPLQLGQFASLATVEAKPLVSRKVDAEKTRRVWVVHGRNDRLRTGLFTYLRSFGLEPLEFSEARKLTGKPLPYVGDILEAAFQHAQAVVVLLTPDDEARLRPEFQTPADPEFEKILTGQARPNVLFEAGMAIVSHRDRTVLVQFGELRPFSDVAGRHLVHMNGSTQKRQELASRLEAAGCSVNLNGTDWHTAGDLTPPLAIAKINQAKKDAATLSLYKTQMKGCTDIMTAADLVASIHKFFASEPLYLNDVNATFLEKYPLNFRDQLSFDASAAMKKWSLDELKRDVETLKAHPSNDN